MPCLPGAHPMRGGRRPVFLGEAERQPRSRVSQEGSVDLISGRSVLAQLVDGRWSSKV